MRYYYFLIYVDIIFNKNINNYNICIKKSYMSLINTYNNRDNMNN